jgi:hypothetical protein
MMTVRSEMTVRQQTGHLAEGAAHERPSGHRIFPGDPA